MCVCVCVSVGAGVVVVLVIVGSHSRVQCCFVGGSDEGRLGEVSVGKRRCSHSSALVAASFATASPHWSRTSPCKNIYIKKK